MTDLVALARALVADAKPKIPADVDRAKLARLVEVELDLVVDDGDDQRIDANETPEGWQRARAAWIAAAADGTVDQAHADRVLAAIAEVDRVRSERTAVTLQSSTPPVRVALSRPPERPGYELAAIAPDGSAIYYRRRTAGRRRVLSDDDFRRITSQ